MKILIKYVKLILIVGVIAFAFYYIGGQQLKETEVKVDLENQESLLPEPGNGTVVEQKLYAITDTLESLTFQPFSYGRENQGLIDFFLLDENGSVIVSTSVKAEDCVDYMPYTMMFGGNIPLNKGGVYTLRIVFNQSIGQNPTFYYTVSGSNESEFIVDGALVINGVPVNGTLCLGMSGTDVELFGLYYWYIVAGVMLFAIVYQLWADYQTRKGKFTILTLFKAIWNHYRFLIEQLVARDFKVKYKRSILGYFWSFLNPLLTMLVQYLVFSSLFRFGIDNFPVYLLSGNIIFSFFTEAVSQGLMSIVGNASLIKKVYVPKYIYPVTKVFSTSINLFISLIPLLLVALIMGEELNWTILLIPYALICLLIFTLGIVLMLSALTVFFRDIEYLWNIISLIWMYATPIFYPPNIIPENLRFIQMLNPIYHIIQLLRSVLMDGISPRPAVYLYCLVGAAVSLGIGTIVFKRTQGKFVLYI